MSWVGSFRQLGMKGEEIIGKGQEATVINGTLGMKIGEEDL